MPYLLPEGDAYTNELSCFLVFAPAKDEYRRALAGSLVGLEVWNIWERDSEHRGQDAARAWKEANQFTFNCMDGSMVCLDSLLEELIAIKLLLSQSRDCCDIPFIYIDDDPVDPPIIDPGVGDPPETWGEEEVITTWQDWEAYVCYYANVYVDNLLGMADSLATYAQLGVFAVMAIAGLLAIAAAFSLIIVVSYPAAAGIVSGLILGSTAVTFLNTRDEIEAGREDIVCAIMQNTGLGDAVEDALASGLAWDLFFQFLNYNQALEVIYTGEYDGQYLEPLTDESCECVDPNEFDITFTFDADAQGWTSWGTGTKNYDGSYGDPAGSLHLRNNNQTASAWQILGDELLDQLGGTGATEITLRELHLRRDADWEGAANVTIKMCTVLVDTIGFWPWSPGTFETYDKVSTQILTNMTEAVVEINHNGTGSGPVSSWWDSIRLVGRYD